MANKTTTKVARLRTLPKLGRYQLKGLLGQGGHAGVYRAYDAELRRHIAVKVLRDDATLDTRHRLVREGRILAQLNHPNVVRLHDMGADDGRIYLVLELVRGQTLERWASKPERTWTEVIEAYAQLGRALAHVHRAGFVHRDVAPKNAMIDPHGKVTLIDFGLAKAVDTLTPASDDVTAIDRWVGTPRYMSPEQFDQARVDPRADQFSFCVSLYESLYHETPFGGASVEEIRKRLQHGGVALPKPDKRVPSQVMLLLVRGLAGNPMSRFSSMDALVDSLEALVRTSRQLGEAIRPLARPPRPVRIQPIPRARSWPAHAG